MYFAEDWVRKSQICKMPHLRKVLVLNSENLRSVLKSVNLRIAELICGPSTW
jgi:hypothetical protein